MTDQRRMHSAKDVQDFMDQLSRRRGETPPALTEDPWDDEKSAALTGEALLRGERQAEQRPSASGGEAVGRSPLRRLTRGSGRNGRSSSPPTAAHARAAAALARTTPPPPPQPQAQPQVAAAPPPPPPPEAEASPAPAAPPEAEASPPPDAPPEAEASPPAPAAARSPWARTIEVNVEEPTNHLPLRDSARRLEPDPWLPSSDPRVVTDRYEREPLRWPVIVLSALVAGGVIILTVVKVKQYTDKPAERTQAVSIAAAPPTPPAPERIAEEPDRVVDERPPADDRPAAPSTDTDRVVAVAPSRATGRASDRSAAATSKRATAGRTSDRSTASSRRSALDRAVSAGILERALKERSAARERAAIGSSVISPADRAGDDSAVRGRPVRVAKSTSARTTPEPEPAARSERSDEKVEPAKPDDPEPDASKARPPEPAPPEPSAVKPDPVASGPRPGSIDVAATRIAARAQIGPVQQCYERARMDDPSLAGAVQARITVAADGSVGKVEVVSSTLRAPQVETCIREAISRWRLPAPTGGVAASLTYPLVFQ